MSSMSLASSSSGIESDTSGAGTSKALSFSITSGNTESSGSYGNSWYSRTWSPRDCSPSTKSSLRKLGRRLRFQISHIHYIRIEWQFNIAHSMFRVINDITPSSSCTGTTGSSSGMISVSRGQGCTRLHLGRWTRISMKPNCISSDNEMYIIHKQDLKPNHIYMSIVSSLHLLKHLKHKKTQ